MACIPDSHTQHAIAHTVSTGHLSLHLIWGYPLQHPQLLQRAYCLPAVLSQMHWPALPVTTWQKLATRRLRAQPAHAPVVVVRGSLSSEHLWVILVTAFKLFIAKLLLDKKLSYRRVTARCVLSVVILPLTTQQCRNYLYDKSWPNW